MKTEPEIIYVPTSENSHAILTILISTEGLGHIDPPVFTKPTISELETITKQLAARKYTLTPPPL